ncbi:MAG: PVC-type heme-binding CxxCH protein, partial [Pirellulaceae bacterium]
MVLLLLGGGWLGAQEKDNPLEGADFKAELPQLKPRSREQARQAVQARPGFRLELVASEPLVRDPIAMAFDENSHLFVVEFPEYNHEHAGWKIVRKGSVRRLVDTDDDGVFDQSSVYVDQLDSPTAVACYDGGIFVASAPHVLFFKDTDGDGRADVRKKIFTGFAISENRGGGARLNSIRWGIDRQFHLCTSFSGGLVRSVLNPKQVPLDVRNRGFQFDPRSYHMTATSGAGQHGLAFDDWGRMFTCRNSDPFKQIMYESRYITRNPYLVAEAAEVNIAANGKFTELRRRSPLEPWRVLRTQLRVDGKYRGSSEGGTAGGFFTAATGIVVYRGDAWPAEYRGNLFVGEVSNNLVHRATLTGNGLQKSAQRGDPKVEFLASRDNWFRPVELINGPDGNLYVADMHRELIETALALPPEIVKHLTVSSGVQKGRIYRIVRDAGNGRKLPKIGGRSTSQLVGLLDHRNGWHRDTASRLLYHRFDPAALAPL